MLGQRQLETVVAYAAGGAWRLLQSINRQVPGGSFQPTWAAAPLSSSPQRSTPALGWPRTTDSLCPRCVREARQRILAGDIDLDALVNDKSGEIKARIFERDGKVLIEKTCPEHGTFSDVLAVNPDFLRRIERLFPGRDYAAVTDRLHNHGTSSIKYGRGAVLTVDLTNRCNMMCDPCFMDANQVGYVHELTLDEVKRILDDALTIKPRRQLSVQFSGGEPTISPIFLDAVAYARQIGYYSAQAATNGIHFAQDADYAMAAAKAGLRIAYLQFDGVGEDANARHTALHAVAPRGGRQAADRRDGAAPRLVSAVGGGRRVRCDRPDRRARRRVGHDEVRLPPELRHRDGAARQQEDEAVGAAAGG